MAHAAPAAKSTERVPSASGRSHPALVLIAVALGVMMVSLDGTVVAVANPSIGTDLGASLADLQWVTNGYLLALAVFLITAGKLGDRYGHKMMFLTGIAGFGATSLAIGLSRGIAVLIAMRVLQGVFGALLQPAALGLLRAAFPAEKLNMALGIWGAAIASSTAAGPIIGGLLVEHVSWQSVFYINVPVGIVAFLIGFIVLTNERGERSSLDLFGIVLLSGAMFALVYGIIKAPSWGWGDANTLLFFAAAAVLLAAFLVWESRCSAPLLPLSLFRNASVSLGTVLMLAVTFGMFGALFFLTFYLQSVHGLSPVDSGVRLLPMMLAMMVFSPIAGLAITKLGPKIPLMAGPIMTTLAFVGLTRLGLEGGFTDTLPWFLLLGAGLSPVFVGATDIIVGNAPVTMAGVASGVQNAAMQIGGALGTAVLGALMTAKVGSSLPDRFVEVGLPRITSAEADQLKEAVASGVAPVPEGTGAQAAELITKASHLAFLDGMHLAFWVAAVVSLGATAIAAFVKAGRKVEGGGVHI